MKNLYSSCKGLLVVVGLFLLQMNTTAQSIQVTSVSSTPVCAGTTVTVTFTATNGSSGSKDWFRPSAVFQVYLFRAGTASPYAITATLDNLTKPEEFSERKGYVYNGNTGTFVIPANTEWGGIPS